MGAGTNIGTGSEMWFIRRVLIFLGLAALAAAVWALADILLLIFGSVLVAVALRAISDPLMTHVRSPERWSLILAVLLVISVIATAALFLGPALSVQMRQLYDVMPNAFARMAEVLQLGSFADLLKGAGTASTRQYAGPNFYMEHNDTRRFGIDRTGDRGWHLSGCRSAPLSTGPRQTVPAN